MTADMYRKATAGWVAALCVAGGVAGGAEPAVLLSGDCEAELLAKARPDESFYGVGNPSNTYSFGDQGLTQAEIDGCAAGGGRPKVNQAYVWGMTRCESNLWFGTAANVLSLVGGSYLGMTDASTAAWHVAEFGGSAFCNPPFSLPDSLGDWRPPHIYVYNTADRVLTGKDVALSGAASNLLAATLGIRSAGASEASAVNPSRVVFLGGPALPALGGINLFAFDGNTGECLGATNLPAYDNIRKWLNVGGALYTGVGDTAGGGSVLRWSDNPGRPGYPFAFDVVGELDNSASELAFHEGRLFALTWPCEGAYPGEDMDMDDMLDALARPAALWMSPPVPADGLTGEDASKWVIVWRVTSYEPDAIIAATYGGGAMLSYQGYLYWGTMHVPFMSGKALELAYEYLNGFPPTGDVADEIAVNSVRASSIFRGRNFRVPIEMANPISGPPITILSGGEFELLYGEKTLSKYDIMGGSGWLTVANKMGCSPSYGRSGFGNPYNNYTWTMLEYKGELYVGTMDSEIVQNKARNLGRTLGADLFRFPSASGPAVPVSRTGLLNYSSYGVRTAVKDDDYMYLGMANPMNLLTATNDSLPEGGWELLRVANIYRPTLRWAGVPGASWYQVWLNLNGRKLAAPWLRQTTTAWSPDFSLAAGDYDCWVRAWGEAIGYGPWVELPSFIIPAHPVGAPKLLSPAGVSRSGADYVWGQVDYATWYQLWVNRGSTVCINRWIERDNVYETPDDVGMKFGSYEFWVRAWNADGMGQWSTSVVFTVGQIQSTDLKIPHDDVAASPKEYRWRDRYAEADAYRIWIGYTNGVAVWDRTVAAAETVVVQSGGQAQRQYNGADLPLLAPGAYVWWLRMARDGVAAPWSGGRSFRVLPPP